MKEKKSPKRKTPAKKVKRDTWHDDPIATPEDRACWDRAKSQSRSTAEGRS